MGILIYQEFNFWLCIFSATLGNTLGGFTSYYIGYLGKWEWIEKYFGVKQEKIMSSKNYMDRYGSYLAIFTTLPIVGDPLAIALGFFRVHFWKMAFWMLVGKFIKYVLIAYLVVQGANAISG